MSLHPTTGGAEDIGRLRVGGTLGLTLRILGRAPLSFLGLLLLQLILTTLVVFGFERVTRTIVPDAVAEVLNYLLEQASAALAIGAEVVGSVEIAEDRVFALGEALAESARHVLPMFLVCLLQALAVGIGIVLLLVNASFAMLIAATGLPGAIDRPLLLAAIGLILTVPGIVAAILFSVALPACMIERLGPIASFARSLGLTHGNRLRILGIFAIAAGASAIPIGAMLLVIWEPNAIAYTVATAGVLGGVALILAWMILPAALYVELGALELERQL